MIKLSDSIKYLKTVGLRREKFLNKIGIYCVKDLIYYFPRYIQDRRKLSLFENNITLSQKITVVGKIVTYEIVYTKNKFGIFKVTIETDIKKFPLLNLIWFKKINKKFDVFTTLKKHIGQEYLNKYIIAYGKISGQIKRIPEVLVEDYELLKSLEEETIHTKRLVPIYSLNTNLKQQWFRELVYNTIKKINFNEHLPKFVIEKEKFLELNSAIKNVHFPDSWQLYNESKKRLMFDKFLFLQIQVQKLKKQLMNKEKVGKYQLKKFLLTPFKHKLSSTINNFDFTSSQKRVIKDLFNDMMSKTAMNRILIGDVGSGKTLVAVSCILLAIENGYQSVFMSPTEILAQQHYFNLMTYFDGLLNPITGKNIKIFLYLGKTPKKEKDLILRQLNNGEIDLLIGTHSLLEEKVEFKNLSLIVIDEQHKFGVLQRKKLYDKSLLADVLIMTATPIPRSLAMTLYGELDISILDELPPGRKTVETRFYQDETVAYEFILERLSFGEKIYFVYPTIEENKLELKSLIEEYKKLSTTIFKNYPCGILHGKMTTQEKQLQMLRFKSGEYKILFSTTVIEVGIDIPDATVMFINHVERFGLSTLHQLRGRVGRADKQSYCILVGNITTEEAKKRVDVMLETNDGFKIAQKDIEIRGPGEIFGYSQHGKSEIDYSDVLKYSDILSKAKEYAKNIVLEEKFSFEEINLLMNNLEVRNKEFIQLGKVG